ncbi:unnamed protein product [Fusarium venenatum]|uniref:Uncharacterized protein n=1 Tax=Fusarium venenatum TaxID=56646 RepID=A0A2L2SXP8_9HYPO|nr:uncharacterized protein FVRRES_05935 [Fusarium venenatum]CEI61499.1 unnamed protein product [Fusarium venenatum]
MRSTRRNTYPYIAKVMRLLQEGFVRGIVWWESLNAVEYAGYIGGGDGVYRHDDLGTEAVELEGKRSAIVVARSEVLKRTYQVITLVAERALGSRPTSWAKPNGIDIEFHTGSLAQGRAIRGYRAYSPALVADPFNGGELGS